MIVLSLFKGEIEVAPPVTMRGLLVETALAYGLQPSDLQSTSRAHRIAHPRQEFMWRCRQVKNPDGSHRYSLPKIGTFLGGMDHTSVLWGVRQHEKRRGAA